MTDYYRSPDVTRSGMPGTGTAEGRDLNRRAEQDVAWSYAAKDQMSLAWHAIDAFNYAAAKAAIERAAFYIAAMELSYDNDGPR